MIFSSDTQLALLSAAKLVQMDATFRVAPVLYYQLFTLFVLHAGHAFPVLFALMTRKTTDLYIAVMTKVRELVPAMQLEQVLSDYEDASVAAVRFVFGHDVSISGCWFHYAQAIIKKVRQLGLTDAYRNTVDAQSLVKCLLSLPLLPACDIPKAFDDVKSLIQPQSPIRQQLEQMFRYVEKQWLTKATIGPTRLSVRDNHARTNNAVESFHSALRRRIKVAHPNIFVFLGHIQRLVIDCQTEVSRIDRGMPIRRAKKRANILNEKRIQCCIGRYDSKLYTRIQFLNAVSHSLGMHNDDLFLRDLRDASGDEQAPNESVGDAAGSDASVDPELSAADTCDVCLVAPREARVALVPCGHQRFCEPCATAVHAQGRGCPICRSDITMLLRLY